MKRLLLAGSAALALLLGATACGSVDPEAFAVNGEHTSARDFERTLGLLRDAGATEFGATNGTLDAKQARVVLANLVVITVFHDEFRERGLQVDAADAQSAAALPPQIFAMQNPAAWDKMPEDVKAKWNGLSAEYLAVRTALAGPPPSEADIQAFYEANKDQVNGATLEELRPQIVQELTSQATSAAANQLLDKARVTINPRYGAWDPLQGVVSLDAAGTADPTAP